MATKPPRSARSRRPHAGAMAVMLLLLAAIATTAAELVVLSAGAMEPAVQPLVNEFRRGSGHAVVVEFGTAPELTDRLSRNQPGDVLIAPTSVMDQAVAARRADASTRQKLGRIGVGVFVRRGGRVPDVSTREKLRAAILESSAVVYTRGSSGQYIDTLLSTLGVDAQIQSKTVRTADADAALARVAAGTTGDLGFGAITAIRAHDARGTQYVAPLPEDLQNFTTYEAAIRAGARTADTAAAFLRFLSTPAARSLLQAAGVQSP